MPFSSYIGRKFRYILVDLALGTLCLADIKLFVFRKLQKIGQTFFERFVCRLDIRCFLHLRTIPEKPAQSEYRYTGKHQ